MAFKNLIKNRKGVTVGSVYLVPATDDPKEAWHQYDYEVFVELREPSSWRSRHEPEYDIRLRVSTKIAYVGCGVFLIIAQVSKGQHVIFPMNTLAEFTQFLQRDESDDCDN